MADLALVAEAAKEEDASAALNSSGLVGQRLLDNSRANEPTSARYRRMAEAWTALTNEQDWLDGQPAQRQTERASDLAEGAIDRLSEEGASSADVNDRKTRLIGGPAEFKDTRVDND